MADFIGMICFGWLEFVFLLFGAHLLEAWIATLIRPKGKFVWQIVQPAKYDWVWTKEE